MKESNNMKADYVQYVAKGMILLHSAETRDAILQLLKGKNPVQMVANATVVIIQKLDSVTRNAGQEIQDVVKLFAAHEFVKQIAEIAEAARLFKLDDAHQELALSVAVQNYVRSEISAGRIDPVRLEAQVAKETRAMPIDQRKEMMQSIARIQKTAIADRGVQ
ncbi:MAG: hypothetical protein WC373_14215 [Smithella sp.]|jgi:hypothetical protein